MEITVSHMNRDRNTGVISFSDVAIVDAPAELSVEEALEYAFRWTNNLNGSWSKGEEIGYGGMLMENTDFNPRVTALKFREDGMGLRSTSMFDRMTANGKTYEVAGFGFEEVDA